MLLPEYYNQWANYLNGIDEDLWRSIKTVLIVLTVFKKFGTTGEAEYMIAQGNKKKGNDK